MEPMIGRECPACGNRTFRGRRWSLADPRECDACGTWYTPPLPAIGSVLALLCGLAVGCVALFFTWAFAESLARGGMGLVVAPVLGLMIALNVYASVAICRSAIRELKGPRNAQRRGFLVGVTETRQDLKALDDNCKMMPMDYDTEKVDEAVFALLFLTLHETHPEFGGRSWKGHDWEALNRLHEKGLISDPKSSAKSVELSAESVKKCEAAFLKLFGKTQR